MGGGEAPGSLWSGAAGGGGTEGDSSAQGRGVWASHERRTIPHQAEVVCEHLSST